MSGRAELLQNAVAAVSSWRARLILVAFISAGAWPTMPLSEIHRQWRTRSVSGSQVPLSFQNL